MTLIAFVGNCQVTGIGEAFHTMTPSIDVVDASTAARQKGRTSIEAIARGCDVVFAQKHIHHIVKKALDDAGKRTPLYLIPEVYFTGFHPDFIYAYTGKAYLSSPLGHIHSAIALFGWQQKLNVEETASLFTKESYTALGYFDHQAESERAIVASGAECGFDLSDELVHWQRSGCFMHTPNHPKIRVLAGIARAAHKKLGLGPVSV